MAPSVNIVTLGCAKNEVDSDRMRALLRTAGYDVLDDGAGDGLADVMIVNTCSFITEATQESVDAILALVEERAELDASIRDARALRDVKIVVTGCMPSRYGEELAEEIPEVDVFLPVTGEEGIVDVVAGLVGPAKAAGKPGEAPLLERTLQSPAAYVKISDGCDRFCAFCTIPFIRGRYASRPAAEIVKEVDGLVELGVLEVTLIGQDTGIWGDDLDDGCLPGLLRENTLACLLGFLAERHPQVWFRVMYLQPKRTDDELLAVMASHANICSYLDIPLQHANARVLSEMNRDGSGSEYLELVEHIRETVEGVALRTTMIAGFPGETDSDADELLDFIEQAGFDYAGVFEYSQEDGTAAGRRSDQVAPETKHARAQELRDAAEEIGFARARGHVGEVCEVLVCGVDEEAGEALDAEAAPLWGRTMFQAPDVDGVVTFEGPLSLVGSFARVRITDAYGYDLEGSVLI